MENEKIFKARECVFYFKNSCRECCMPSRLDDVRSSLSKTKIFPLRQIKVLYQKMLQ